MFELSEDTNSDKNPIMTGNIIWERDCPIFQIISIFIKNSSKNVLPKPEPQLEMHCSIYFPRQKSLKLLPFTKVGLENHFYIHFQYLTVIANILF